MDTESWGVHMAIQNDGEEPTVPHVPLTAVHQFFKGGNQAQHARQLWFSDPRHRALAAGMGLLLLVGTVVTVGLLHIAASKPDGYLFTSHTEVAFIQFTADQSGHLSGSLQDVSATSDETISANLQKVGQASSIFGCAGPSRLTGRLPQLPAVCCKNEDDAFTGVQNSSQVSLTFSALGFSSTVTGTLSGDTLTLLVPDQNGYVATEVFHAASVSDYNTAAAQLRQQVAVLAANNQLSSDLSTLSSDV